jgi:hypothetical protein
VLDAGVLVARIHTAATPTVVARRGLRIAIGDARGSVAVISVP